MKITNIDPIVNMVLNPLTPEEAAVAGFRVMYREAARYGGLENMLSRSKDLLQRIEQLNKEIEALKERAGAAERALTESRNACRLIAAEQALKTESELTQRFTIALRRMISGDDQKTPAIDIQVPRNPAKVRVSGKSAASAPARSVRRVKAKKRRGADSEELVLNLLTKQWKCISTLRRQANRKGFTGSEGTIRFAAERLTDAGKAVEGQDHEGRIAYRAV